MPYQNGKILVSWSGGKESAMALKDLLQHREYEVGGLITVLNSDNDRVFENFVSKEMISLQAASLGLPVEFIYLPANYSKATYKENISASLKPYKDQGFTHIAFGDLFLDDLRDQREDCFDSIGFHCEFPYWQRCSKEHALAFINAKFKAVITAVNRDHLSEDYLCRTYDRGLLSDLPVNVDQCGENGEFQTFVFAGPLFKTPLSIKSGTQHQAGNMIYCDLVPKMAVPNGLPAAASR